MWSIVSSSHIIPHGTTNLLYKYYYRSQGGWEGFRFRIQLHYLFCLSVRSVAVKRDKSNGGKLRWEQSSSAPFVGSLGHRSFPTEAGDLQGGASHWCIDQDICTKHAMFSCQFLANHPQTFQWKFWVQWTTIFRRKVFALPGNRIQVLLLSVQLLYHWATRLGQLNKEQLRNMHCFWGWLL